MKTNDRLNEINEKKNLYIKIKRFYNERKTEELIKQTTLYLKKHPNDINVRIMRAKGYRQSGKLKESMNDLLYVLNIEYNEYAILELYFVYYHLNMYEKALNLIPKLKNLDCISDYTIQVSEFIMKKALGLEVNKKTLEKWNYICSQVEKYDEKKAYDHIKNHKIYQKPGKSTFIQNVNINYLINLVKENIKNTNNISREEILDIRYFYIRNIGFMDGNTCNIIKVATLPNSKKIINIYPTCYSSHKEPVVIEYDHDKLFEKNKSNNVSMVDKFNKRYSR